MDSRSHCKRFRALAELRDERSLTDAEDLFVSSHASDCVECRALLDTQATALNLLRESTLDPQISTGFDERVVRMVRVQAKRESVGYWSPALIGAAIACIAIFAVLQIAATPTQLKSAVLPNGEVKRDIKADQPLPSLILDEKPRLDQ